MNVELEQRQVKGGGPVQGSERIQVLDVIRGFALLGILMVNMAFFSYPMIYIELTGAEIWASTWDIVAKGFINLFFEGKFYSMFSFLFGLGFTIFIERATTRVKRPTLLFLRRLAVLLLIGLFHAFYIWSGDILVTYALLGFLLPVFYKRKPKTILIWALIFFLFAIIPTALSVVAASFAPDGFEVYMQEFQAEMHGRKINSSYAYGQGAFSDIMAQRAQDTLLMYNYLLFAVPLVFPMFLFGLWAGKKKILQNIPENLPFIKKVWKWSLVIGLSMSVVKFYSKAMLDVAFGSKYDIYAVVSQVFADPGLCFFYVTSLILLWQIPRWQRYLNYIANVGRMALTNYLLQSILCTTIFYSYGLGLYGQIGPALGLILTISIFSGQIYLSKKYFERYSYGPMEYLWRLLTYGKFRDKDSKVEKFIL